MLKTRTFLNFALLISIALLVGCGHFHKPPPKDPTPTGKIPDDAVAIVSINEEGRLTLLDPQGGPPARCALCKTSDESECAKNAQGLPICSGLTNATITDVFPITVLRSIKNPRCIAFIYSDNVIIDIIPQGCSL